MTYDPHDPERIREHAARDGRHQRKDWSFYEGLQAEARPVYDAEFEAQFREDR